MAYRRFMMIITIVVGLFMQSCGPLNVGTLPELQGGSPLSGIEPVTFVINKFEDKRADFHGVETIKETELYLDMGEKGGKIKLRELDRSVSDIIMQIIASELRRTGHKVLEIEDSKKAEVIIDGIILQYHFEAQGGGYFSTATFTANVKVTITVIDNLHSEKMLSKTYGGIVMNPKGAKVKFIDEIKEVALNMVKDFTTDKDFLDVMKRIKKTQ